MQFVFNDFLVNNKVDKVLLAASWKDEDLPALSITLDTLKSSGNRRHGARADRRIRRRLPRLLVDEILRNDPAIASAMRTPGIRERDRAMARLVTAKGATYVSVYDVGLPRVAAATNSSTATFRCSSTPVISPRRDRSKWRRRLTASFVKMLARADHAPN